MTGEAVYNGGKPPTIDEAVRHVTQRITYVTGSS